MELMQFYMWAGLVLSMILCKIAECSAKPTYGYDQDYNRYERSYSDSSSNSDNAYALTYGKPLTHERLKNLSTGYYYVDDGYIAPVPSSSGGGGNQRRRDPAVDRDGDSDSDRLPNNVRFTPLVRYKQTHTKRKKLFVPNFFG